MHPNFSALLPAVLCLGLAGGVAQAQTTPSIARPSATLTVAEGAGSVSIPLSITNPGAAASTVQVAVQALGTATAGQDFTYATTQTVTFPAGATGAQTLTIPILDDALAEETEYFVVRLLSPTNATVSATANDILVYITDNDTPAPVRTNGLSLSLVQSYQTPPPFSGSTQVNSAEIAAFDATTKRLYVANSLGGKLDILNLANPAAIAAVASVDIKSYGGLNSVAVRNGLVACAIENSSPQQNGSVVFFAQWHTLEGPFVRRHEGKYYCFFSGANFLTDRYGVDYCVAEHVLGPYVDSGSDAGARVLHSVPGHVRGPGHHSHTMSPDGRTEYLVYHAWNAAMTERELCIDPLAWTANGPRCLGPTYTPQPRPR